MHADVLMPLASRIYHMQMQTINMLFQIGRGGEAEWLEVQQQE
jgi:hypothetical protein